MQAPTQKQVAAAVRYITAIIGSGFVASMLTSKGYTVAQVTGLVQSLGDTVNSLVTLAAALAAIWATGKGVQSASPTSQIASVREIGESSSDQSQNAKAALLDATAAMPEVVGDIKVSDSALVNATTSAQVVHP